MTSNVLPTNILQYQIYTLIIFAITKQIHNERELDHLKDFLLSFNMIQL